MSTRQLTPLDQQDVVLVNAVDLVRSRWSVSAQTAATSLHDIAEETGASLDEVAALVVASAFRPLSPVHL